MFKPNHFTGNINHFVNYFCGKCILHFLLKIPVISSEIKGLFFYVQLRSFELDDECKKYYFSVIDFMLYSLQYI